MNEDPSRSRPATTNAPIEDWTDSELLDQYRFLLAELDDVETGEEGPLEVMRAEIRRRGLKVPPSNHADADNAGRES
jgi:hypothetical protein